MLFSAHLHCYLRARCVSSVLMRGILPGAQYVIGLLTRSHQSLDKTVVATLLNKTLGECEQVVVEKGWKHDEHVVYFPLDDANQAKLSNTSGDKIEFSQLKTVLASLGA